jgi:hypothetical protein
MTLAMSGLSGHTIFNGPARLRIVNVAKASGGLDARSPQPLVDG